MNKLNKILAFAALAAIGFSCNPGFEDDTDTSYDPFVQFSTGSIVAQENAANPTFQFEVQLVGPQLSSDLEVGLNITETNVASGVDYTWSSGTSVTIPAGESTATVSFSVIDNDNITDGAKGLSVTIASVGQGLGTATDGSGRSAVAITITEDDFWCPRNLMSEFVLSEEDLGYSSSPVSISIVTTPEACYGFDIIGGAGSIFATTDARMNGFSIVEDSPESLTGTIVDGDFKIYAADDAAGESPYANAAGDDYVLTITNGEYDLESGVITMDYVLTAGATVYFPGTFVYDNGN
ncbi:hypothetical protein [Marinoscillum pacificum]|uniref:hypothetical protein n=1 Tax=Marinoscillum pacificum TaxID=392723 RepID=UPI0021588A45|nr:hypothetical protein [Marinoscillum pacificum]